MFLSSLEIVKVHEAFLRTFWRYPRALRPMNLYLCLAVLRCGLQEVLLRGCGNAGVLGCPVQLDGRPSGDRCSVELKALRW